MNPEAVQAALTLDRLISYGGFVLWAGTLAFWSLIWPGGHRDRRLFVLALAGAGLLMAGTVAEPLIRLGLGDQDGQSNQHGGPDEGWRELSERLIA